MGGNVILPGIVAVLAGLGLSVLLFVPFVALSYRRRGGLSMGRLLLWLAALIYFWAIWTYTLLPLPSSTTFRCVGYNLDPLDFVPQIRDALAFGGNLLRNRGVQQLVLNVVLFVPLGFFLRVLGGRGVITALLVGLGVSGFIETTQLTGVWGLYPCAYRVFDVVDVETNTLGAVVGSLAALAVPGAWRRRGISPDAGLPRPVTRGRRLQAMVCDGLGVALVGWSAAFVTNLVLLLGRSDRTLDQDAERWLLAVGTGVPIAIWLAVIWITGRSVGDLAVQLRYRGGPLPPFAARTLRALGGVVGFSLLGLFPEPAQALFGVLALATVFFTDAGRGLPGLVSGQRLTDARSAATP